MPKIILIVDDSSSIRAVVSFTLKNAGHEVFEAIDGEDALKHLDGKKIDIIITDLYMPLLDGIGLIREARKLEHYKFIPMILLTTESQETKKQEARQAGATGWIVKPFVPEKLLSVVDKLAR